MNVKTLIPTALISINTLLHAEEKSIKWTPTEMMKTKSISNLQISPDNKSLLFVVTEAVITEDVNKYIPQIYKVNIDGKTRAELFSSPSVASTQPRWSPDGKLIAFLSDRASEGIMNLYILPAEGGEARPLTNSKKAVQSYRWSPNGKEIVFVMPGETETEKNRKKTSDAYEYDKDILVNRLWLVNVEKGNEPLPLTSDEYYVRGFGDFGITNEEFDWSPNGKTIAFSYTTKSGLENFYLESHIAFLDLATGHITPWEKKARYEGTPRYSPDGNTIAYLSDDNPKKYLLHRSISLRSATGEHLTNLAPTFNEGPHLGSNQSLLGWTADAQALYYYEPKSTKYHIMSVPADGTKTKTVLNYDDLMTEPVISRDRQMIAFVSQTPTAPPEVFISPLGHFLPRQLSNVNEALLVNPRPRTDRVYWKAKDGLELEGLLTYPSDYKEGNTYPLLLMIHGGPQGFFNENFLGTPYPYPLAAFADAGYAIFRPNPRGSCGYGKDFRCANYSDWGGKDFEDIMSGVDYVISKGVADPQRMGVMGWSYGGYMTAWTITQTDRFKAASMGAGLANLISMSSTTDLTRFLPDFFNGHFRDQLKIYQERSPIYFVKNIKTPCLIQHGLADLRVPVSQSYEFYHALKQEGKEVSFILYPRTEHGIKDPKMYIDAMERNLAWFNKYLN